MTRFISGEFTSTSSVTEVDSRSGWPNPAQADFPGRGIGDYAEWEDPSPGLQPAYDAKGNAKSYFHLLRRIEDNLCQVLGLMMIQVPLIVLWKAA